MMARLRAAVGCSALLVAGGVACSSAGSTATFAHGSARIVTLSGSLDLPLRSGSLEPESRHLAGSWAGSGATFTATGTAHLGSFPTSTGFRLALRGASGFDSSDGSCTVQITRADSGGVAGDFECRGGTVSGSFTLSA